VPIDEAHPMLPLSPYADSKLAAEAYCHAYARAYGMNTVILRFFNIYGPGQRNTYAGVIQRFIDGVLRSKSPIIYGSGQQVRDFLHVQDATEAIARSLAYEGESHTTFNIDSGKATEIIDLAKLIFRLAGREELKPVRARARKG
jgi:UDP-glucose 4-epimerase